MISILKKKIGNIQLDIKKKGVGKPIKSKKWFIDKLSGLTILLIELNIQKGNVSETWIQKFN